jgi:hypothetical protein
MRDGCIKEFDNMHIEVISNGLGGPSMYLLWLAAQGKIPATISITADTGSELDLLWSDGQRGSAADFFEHHVQPLAKVWGIEAYFVRARDGKGNDMPSIEEYTHQMVDAGKLTHIKMPLFGSNGGRLRQPCTGRWKITAIHQQARRLGATSMRTHQGIHTQELHRVKGIHIGKIDGLNTYRDVEGTISKGPNKGKPRIAKWLTHCYPLIDFNMNRARIQQELDALDLPYVKYSQCDMCPHQNLARWNQRSPERIQEIALLEAKFNGEFFFTDRRIPLLAALEQMRMTPTMFDDADFGCESEAVCGV